MTGVGPNQSGLSLKTLLETPYGQKPPTMYDEDLQGLKEISQFLPCSIASSFLGQTTGWDKTFDNNNNISCEPMWDRAAYTNNAYPGAPTADTQHAFTLDYMEMNKFLEENDIKDASLLSLYQADKVPADMFNVHNNQRCASLCSSNPSTPRSDMPSPSSPGLASPSSPESACYSVDYQYDFAPFVIKGSESSYLAPCKWSTQSTETKSQSILRKSKKQTFVPEEMKDTRYWSRRRKNNLAAKRSRDARRIKENQVAVRATFLEMQNNSLIEEIEQLRVENMRLKQKLNKYEV